MKYLVGIVVLFIFYGCKRGITSEEVGIIYSQQGKVMELVTVANVMDSSFLREHARRLENRDLQSRPYKGLKDGMLLTVTDTNNRGVGIAAPQVGVSCQLIAVQRFDKNGEPFEFYANPEIVYASKTKKMGPEGCLSVPGRRGEVMRSDTIVIRYTDELTFKTSYDTINGFTAVIFQHEIDHLSGVLYIDKLEE